MKDLREIFWYSEKHGDHPWNDDNTTHTHIDDSVYVDVANMLMHMIVEELE